VWRAVLAELAQVLTPENFNAWLASTRALDQDGAVLRVAVPAAFNKTWLEQKLAGKVAGALRTIDDTALHTGRVLRVEYVVEPAACGGPSADVRAS
jgi:chromosomal replication initiation ATPase DnaA